MIINIEIEGKTVTEQIASGAKITLNASRTDLQQSKSYIFPDNVIDGTFTQAQWDVLFESMDIISYQFEKAKNNIFVKYTSGTKEIDLTGSHVRVLNGTETRTAITTGTPIVIDFIKDLGVFNTPSVQKERIIITYGEAISVENIATLATIGVVLTGNGSKFTVAITGRDIKVDFVKNVNEDNVYIKNEYSDSGIVMSA